MKLFWGDLHNHCNISYGFGSINNALEIAKSHLDFACVTGHAMWPDMYARNNETARIIDFHNKGFEKLFENWQDVLHTVNKYNTINLITFQSYEMHNSKLGDHHFISPDSNFPLIYRDTPAEVVHDCGCRAIAVPHHIGYTPGYRGISWNNFQTEISPFIEVYSKHGCAMRENGPFAYYHDMGPLDPRNTVAEGLKHGYVFSFSASTDHHAGFPGSYGDGLTGVWAKGKNREQIWEAMLCGHLYAVTGDRIRCQFFVNDAMMGDKIIAQKRHIYLKCEGDAPLSLVTIRRNGRICVAKSPIVSGMKNSKKRYILRLELGWSNQIEKYYWEGNIHVDDAEILRVQPYYRGRNALSPQDKMADVADATNDFDNMCRFDKHNMLFRCETVCNFSTLHPQTNMFVVEINGALNSRIRLNVNGHTSERTIAELLECGYSEHMRPWPSHAYKMHTAVTAEECSMIIEFDDIPETDCDVYQAEVVQDNGCRAFVSPIFVHR